MRSKELTDVTELVLSLLPSELKPGRAMTEQAEELRLRVGYRMTALTGGIEREIGDTLIREDILRKVLERATDASLHAHTEELKHGYINYRGVRIGVCGTAAVSGGEVAAFRSFSSLNIRIPHEHHGICKKELEEIRRRGTDSILLISPPGAGKTTALREIIRSLSDDGTRIGVVDERGELSCGGLSLGRRTDVLINVPKAAGALMLLKTMSPELIAMDEISAAEDIAAVESIALCAVGLLATAHARDVTELMKRPLTGRLMALDVFRYIITIENSSGRRHYTLEDRKCGG